MDNDITNRKIEESIHNYYTTHHESEEIEIELSLPVCGAHLEMAKVICSKQ